MLASDFRRPGAYQETEEDRYSNAFTGDLYVKLMSVKSDLQILTRLSNERINQIVSTIGSMVREYPPSPAWDPDGRESGIVSTLNYSVSPAVSSRAALSLPASPDMKQAT